MQKFEFFSAKTLKEGLEILHLYKSKARILAGGTGILPLMKQTLIVPQVIISIRGFSELDYINCEENGDINIGALTSIYSIRTSKLIKKRFPILVEAAKQIGSIQLSHMGTLGGNLCLDTRCWYYNQPLYLRKARPLCLKMGGNICHISKKGDRCFAVFSSDMPPSLITLGAEVKLLSIRGERKIHLRDFYTGNGTAPNGLASDEILTEVHIPCTFLNGAYLKYRMRRGLDFPLAGVAVGLKIENGMCKEAKMVLGGVESGPIEVKEVSRIFTGREIDKDLIEIVSQEAYKKSLPVSNAASTPSVRRNMVKTLVKRAIENALSISSS